MMRSVFSLRKVGRTQNGAGQARRPAGLTRSNGCGIKRSLEGHPGQGDSHENDVPEVVTRKRIGRRSGGMRFKLNRWFYRNRPRVAVGIAFIIFVLTGIVFAQLAITSSIHRQAKAESGPGL